jgi:hypothetical protein
MAARMAAAQTNLGLVIGASPAGMVRERHFRRVAVPIQPKNTGKTAENLSQDGIFARFRHA